MGRGNTPAFLRQTYRESRITDMLHRLGLRTRLISLLDGIGALEAAMMVRKHVRLPYLPIVTYHRVGDPERDGAELDEGVIDATKEGFEKQVALFKKHF